MLVWPVTQLMVVVLPAPFGPSSPSTSPMSTRRQMPSTARFTEGLPPVSR